MNNLEWDLNGRQFCFVLFCFFFKLVSLIVSQSLFLLLLTFDITHLSDTKLSFWYLQVVSEPFTEIRLKEHEEKSL